MDSVAHPAIQRWMARTAPTVATRWISKAAGAPCLPQARSVVTAEMGAPAAQGKPCLAITFRPVAAVGTAEREETPPQAHPCLSPTQCQASSSISTPKVGAVELPAAPAPVLAEAQPTEPAG